MGGKRISRAGVLILILAAMLLATTAALAASSRSGYDLSWWTVDGGGTISGTASGYSLGGTIGQPDAAVWTGEGYVLSGGFWGGALVEYNLYLPLMLRGA